MVWICNAPHSLPCLNTWSLCGGAVWRNCRIFSSSDRRVSKTFPTVAENLLVIVVAVYRASEENGVHYVAAPVGDGD